MAIVKQEIEKIGTSHRDPEWSDEKGVFWTLNMMSR